MKNTFKAFTLPELLIAMFIFGMLAVMLIPKVTVNAEKELFVTQTKKVQNDIQQALLLMLSQNSGSLRFLCNGNNCFMSNFQTRLESAMERNAAGDYFFTQADMLPNCNGAMNEKTNKPKDRGQQACRYDGKQPQFINRNVFSPLVYKDNNNFTALNLKNGATVSMIYDNTCEGGFLAADADNFAVTNPGNLPMNKLCGYMQVDVNGAKIPNMVGKDIHYFWITSPDGIVPFGEFGEFRSCDNNQKNAAINANQSLGCTYEMLNRGRIDYY